MRLLYLGMVVYLAAGLGAETPLAAQAAEAAGAATDPWIVDYRFAPERWQTAICLPDDWQKSLVARQGELVYDYPGRFDGFKVRLAFGLADSKPAWVRQELLGPRVPIVRTWKRSGAVEISEEAFAVAPPLAGRGQPARPGPSIVRVDPETKLANWAAPTRPCDPAFRDIAVGFRKPIRYRFPALGERTTVVFGLCEGYHAQPGRRILELRVENKTVKTVDMVAEHGQNVPAVYAFEARDENGDGWIDIAVATAANSVDRNAVLNLFWVYRQAAPAAEELISGHDTSWAVRYECGSSRPPDAVPRHDLLIVRMRNTSQAPVTLRPRVTLRSEFPVRAEAGGRQVTLGTSMAILATQGFKLAESARGTWSLDCDAVTLAAGQEHALALGVLHGPDAQPLPRDVAEAEQLRARAASYWQQLDLPYGHIEVPDPGIQAVLDCSIRNIYQAREIKNGLPAFQVGPTVYRGLWVVDGSFLMEAVAMLGRTAEARSGLRYLLGFQRPDGGIEIIGRHWKETGIMLWALTRHARLTCDQAWLREVWPQVERGVAYLRQMRQSMSDPHAPNYRLVPDGFSDGGVGGSYPEYTNVYWNLVGLRAASEAAAWLGQADEARQWRAEFDDFMSAFRQAAQRDSRLDEHGNRFVPVRMRDDQKLEPQRGQWAFLHAIYPGQLFASDDPLMRGNLAMLQSNEREGLVYGTSVPGAIWGYLGSFYAHAWLWLGDGEKAARTLYAFANHASPLGVWREEQVPVGVVDPRNFGDMPHNWASAEFIRLVRHLLVLERGNELHLCEGLPACWIRPGAVVRLREVLTEFGPLSLELRVAPDAQTAQLHVDPPRSSPAAAIKLHLGRWAAAANGETVLSLPPNQASDRTLSLKTPVPVVH